MAATARSRRRFYYIEIRNFCPALALTHNTSDSQHSAIFRRSIYRAIQGEILFHLCDAAGAGTGDNADVEVVAGVLSFICIIRIIFILCGAILIANISIYIHLIIRYIFINRDIKVYILRFSSNTDICIYSCS